MRNDLAKLTLDGNLGADPTLRETTSGKVLKFSLGNHVRKPVRNGQAEEHTQWFDVEVWRNAESLAKILIKGSEVTVIGDLLVDDWEGRKGKNQRLVVRSAEVRLRGSIFAAKPGFGEIPAAVRPVAAENPADLTEEPFAGKPAAEVLPAVPEKEEMVSEPAAEPQPEDFSDFSRQLDVEEIDFFAD